MMAPGPAETLSSEHLQPPPSSGAAALVDRTCTEIPPDGVRGKPTEARPLSDFRAVPAYVLLGDPGAGKTTEFEREREALGDAATKVTARNFITPDPPRSEWHDKTLFIDGLDEMRAGATDARPSLDAIRSQLYRLEQPRFRISCREADWLGNNDLQALAAVSPDARITVLRLDPLSPSAMRELLALRHPTLDAQDFAVEALRRGIHSMLSNPLTLTLLAEAVAPSGSWPSSRLDTFETACRQIAREHNPEHRAVARGARALGTVNDPESLVSAAGYLCALVLLAGIEGFSLEAGTWNSSFVPLENLGEVTGYPSLQTSNAALGTKLFRGSEAIGFVPLHRHVAEFLAGRYLAQRIGQGLPARRVVALMRGPSDGRVVTVLRGLSAWLAAHSPEARRVLIGADPVGVALYGDIRGFTTNDKRRLLQALEQLAPNEPIFDYEQPDTRDGAYWTDTALSFRSLATADMVRPIRNILNREGTESADERLVQLMLDALCKVERSKTRHLGDLLVDLEALVRDGSRSTTLRRSALDAYRRIASPGDDRTQELLALLKELHDGTVSDPNGELRGTLLNDLYPTAIPPSELWKYALGTVQRDYYVVGMRFDGFWDHVLPEQSSDDQVAALLDALHDGGPDLIVALEEQGRLTDLPMKLLARGLTVFGEEIEVQRLYRWLSIPGPHSWGPGRADKSTLAVRTWLKAHPQLQKSVYVTWLEHWIATDPAQTRALWVLDQPYQTILPADFGLWCLEKAIEVSDSDPVVSQALLGRSFCSLNDPSVNEGLTLEVIRARTRGHRELERHLEALGPELSGKRDPSLEAQIQQMEERHARQLEQERQRSEEWAQHLRSQEAELRENRFSPQNLHTLAQAHLGLFSDSDAQRPPRSRLADFVGNDPVAVDAALAGLRGAVWRHDIPEVDETISRHLESQQSWLAYPVLASLHLLDEEDPSGLDSLDGTVKRKALALYYCGPSTVEISRDWCDRWLRQDRDLVLDVVQRCALSAIRAGRDLPDRLRELDGVENHEDPSPGPRMVYLGTGVGPRVLGDDEELVHDLRLQLLRAFPLRGPNEQLFLLERLLTEVLECEDTASLRALIEQKLSRKSMSAGQRVRWLAVDAALQRTPGIGGLKAFVGDSEVRTRHLADFLAHSAESARRTTADSRSLWSVLSFGRDPATLMDAIDMLGRFFAPVDWGGHSTTEREVSQLVASLIGQLGSISDGEAGQALTELIDDPRLAAWQAHLNWSRGRQRVVNRDASYAHRSIEEIQGTLDNRAPANAADLAALLSVRLEDIAADVRGGSSDRWRQFWSNDHDDQRRTPKVENSCRDAVLAALQTRLPSEVDAVPEGHYAAERRADIRASCSGFNVPVEIKRNSDPNLWSALRTQLIPSYTTDPDTEGYGIYLVLWFGADQTKRGPDGTRPAKPGELERQLKSTLTPDEARKISVIVMDVTKPGDPKESDTRESSGA